MKKFLGILVISIAAAFCATAVYGDDFAITFEQLPAVSQSFVKTHFLGIQVAYCTKDSHSFEVHMGDGSEIEFDYLGNWEDVDCKYKAVPDSVIELIPVEIPNYVKANFPSTLITKVKVKTWGYELELNTGLELEFNKAGKFLRIDD